VRRRRPATTGGKTTAAATLLLACCIACSGSAGAGTKTREVRATGTAASSATGTAASPTARPSATGELPTARAEGPPLPPKPPSPSALPVAPGAGRLGQTSASPSTKSVAFTNAMHDLWLAVTTGEPRLALPAFFPEAAYAQVKAIADPQSDWQYRLWYDFTLDVAAAHGLLGHGAELVRVIVPTEYAAWVYPGDCYNSVGYWHVPGARVVYRQGSRLRSFGIASLISWRGDWYVIHFGAVLRGGGYGEVDEPTDGTGIPGPPGGC
jgi:hypothetical protein